MSWAFDEEKIAGLLSIINGGPEDMSLWDLYKAVTPEWLDGLDPDAVVAESHKLILCGKADGVMDSCVFKLDATSGEISFMADYLQPREELGVLQAPVWWISKKPWPQPTETNMWVAKAGAIKAELLKCRIRV